MSSVPLVRTAATARVSHLTPGRSPSPDRASSTGCRSLLLLVKQRTYARHHELLEERFHLLRAIRSPVVQPPVDQGEERACQVVGDDLGWYLERTRDGDERQLLCGAV